MSDDRDETRPAGPSRSELAASTLRALRAGRGGGTAPPAGPGPDEPGSDVPASDEASDGTGDTASGTPPDVEAPVVEAPVVEAPVVEAPVVEASVVEAPVVEVPASGTPVAEPFGADADEDEAQAETGTAPIDEPVDESAAGGASRPPRGRALTVVCAVLAAAALVFAVVAGVIWWTAGHSQQRKLGLARDAVSTDARLAIVTVNTSDYRHPSAALSNWLDVSTGALHTQFSQSRSAAVKLLAQAETVTRATVLGEAVTSVDLSKGTASVIASVNVTRVHQGSTSTVRNRFRATVARVGGQWKLSNLTVVAVSLS